MKTHLFLVINLNPAWQKIYSFLKLRIGEVNRVTDVLECAAGKGTNVARALTFLKEKSLLLGYVGGSLNKAFKQNLILEGIGSDFTKISHSLRICTTLLDKQTDKITEITEPGAPLSSNEKKKFKKKLITYIPSATAVIISGSAPQTESNDIYLNIIKQARKNNVLSFLDSYGRHAKKALCASPDIFKINKNELEELLKKKLSTVSSIKSALFSLKNKYNIKTIIITNGAYPIFSLHNNQLYTIYPPKKISVVNSIGSGDAFSAGYLSSYLKTFDIKKSLLQGTACGTANTMNIKPGKILLTDIKKIKNKIKIITSLR